MRLLLVEPHAFGHHASYLRWLVQAAVQRQWRVTIATTLEALTHPSLAGIADEFRDVQIHVMEDIPRRHGSPSRIRLLQREFAYWKAFKRVAVELRRTASFDAAILPYVDYCFYAIAIRGSPFQELPWSGISMRLSVESSPRRRHFSLPLKWRFAIRILSEPTLRGLFVINPSVEDFPSNWSSSALLVKLRYLRDPAEFRATVAPKSARSTVGIAKDQISILVFGSIDERKGIDALLESILKHQEFQRYVVILAGKHSEALRVQLGATGYDCLRSSNRLIVIDHFLTDAEQDLVLAAADVVWVAYRNHFYMSGVLVLAGRAALPVIGSVGGEIGRLISRNGLGAVARIDNPLEVEQALRVMLDADTRRKMGQQAQLTFASHTVQKFGADVLGTLPAPGIDNQTVHGLLNGAGSFGE